MTTAVVDRTTGGGGAHAAVVARAGAVPVARNGVSRDTTRALAAPADRAPGRTRRSGAKGPVS
ncbi:hypothetical protein [Streptomyces sp. URMC 129]|uniref:hypothetical protein n=1 Tax=Streptomyces sp. URMC 129 TaxID=3423407 RepID=UPI003F19BDFC